MRNTSRFRSVVAATILLWTNSAAHSALAFVTPSFLFDYTQQYYFYDYRPAVNAAGTRLVFERTNAGSSGSNCQTVPAGFVCGIDLYIANLSAPASTAQRLVPNNAGTNRPDWCWLSSDPSTDGPIVFSTGAVPAGVADTLTGLYYTNLRPQPGGGISSVPGTTNGMIYPTWYPGCGQLAVYVNDAISYNGQGGPELEKFGLDGTSLGSLSGTSLWAGFGSVNSKMPRLLAVAAQQFDAANGSYDQDKNYIYIANTLSSPPRVTPLDPQAPVNVYDGRYEGRAPTFSPDGRWIAFESNRYCGGMFAIFLQDANGERPAKQVTDCKYNTQHAKWFSRPMGGKTLLVVSARPFPGISGPPAMQNAMGIATLDITPLVSAP